MEFTDVIQTRVSTRSFSEKMIHEEDIIYLLKCAQKAPSWMNKQCWRFIVVKEAETISKISKSSVINHWIKKAPVLIIACADPTQSGNNNDIPFYIVDVTIAFEHLILAATNRELGTCWIGGFSEEKIKKILEIPPRIKVIALTPLGYPTDQESLGSKTRKTLARSTKRKSLEEIVHWEHW